MEDLAAKQRLRRPLGEDAARVASSDGGSAAVYGLDSTPAKGTQPAEGAQPRKATHPLATQAIAEHENAVVTTHPRPQYTRFYSRVWALPFRTSLQGTCREVLYVLQPRILYRPC